MGSASEIRSTRRLSLRERTFVNGVDSDWLHRLDDMMGLSGAGFGPTPGNMNSVYHTELSSHEGTRCQFNNGRGAIKSAEGRIGRYVGLGIDVHQDFYVVVMQEGGANPKPPQRFAKQAFVHWAAKLKSRVAQVHAVYEACGFGFGLQRTLTALGIDCQVLCPQKLDERNKRVKTDGLDAKALCLRLDRFVQGNSDALALVCCNSGSFTMADLL